MKRFITFILPGLLLVSGAATRADDDETDGSFALQGNVAGHSALVLLSPDRTWSSSIPEITSDETCANLVGTSGRAGSNSLTVTNASLGSQGCSVSGSY